MAFTVPAAREEEAPEPPAREAAKGEAAPSVRESARPANLACPKLPRVADAVCPKAPRFAAGAAERRLPPPSPAAAGADKAEPSFVPALLPAKPSRAALSSL